MVLQISCLRAEQTQLTRSLDKERQRAAENRQEYLALKEEAETNEGRVNQLEEEIKELRRKHKQELQEALTHQELLRQVTILCFTFLLICCVNAFLHRWCLWFYMQHNFNMIKMLQSKNMKISFCRFTHFFIFIS